MEIYDNIKFNARVKFKKLRDDATLPSKGSKYAAGYDLYAAIDEPVKIYPHDTTMIGTGLAAAAPASIWLGIFARSGLASKQGLRPANCVGVVDPDYRGEIKVALHNDSEEVRIVSPGDRIGQLLAMPRFEINMEVVDDLDETDRGSGGFGSTGK